MMKQRIFPFSAIVLVCAAMVGCATQNANTAATPEAFNKALADADAVAKSGDQARALALYDQLAKSDPTREEPWSRIAQIQFSQSHYGQAIVAAQEALSRDQTDREAKSVLAVSGLRVATESLGQLRQDAALAGDAKSDAQVLAHQLRDTLGQSTLFPEDADEKKQAVKKRRVVRHAAAQQKSAEKSAEKSADKPAEAAAAAPSAPAQKSAPAQSAKSGGAADPFSALR
jgi:tetratricopeptide (TPR) repeat protein